MRFVPLIAAVAATTATLLLLDLVWLGVIARSFYASALGPLGRPDVVWTAAFLFYALYLTAIVRFAVMGPGGLRVVAWRGASLGLVAYGTYDLTNWAVLQGWSVALVPVDMGWGVFLTAVAAVAGRATLDRLQRAA